MYRLGFILSLTLTTVLASPFNVASVRSSSASYSYDPNSGLGPNDWGSILGYETCGTGMSQSPIDIVFKDIKIAPRSKGPLPTFLEAKMKFETKTENFELNCEEEGKCGYTMLKGERFNLANLHWHSGSEHVVRGKQFPLEMHMVHTSESGEILVIGTLFKYFGKGTKGGTKKNEVFEEILDQIESGKKDVEVDMARLLRKRGYIGYSGSLTTPPCTEGVNWFISLKVQPISKRQVLRYRSIADSGSFRNHRPVQPLNGRQLTAYVLSK